MEIVVVARAQAGAGHEETVHQALKSAIAPTLEESGCLRYALHRGVENPGLFMVLERWTSKDALDAHLATAHVQKLFATVSAAGVLAAPPEIVVMQPLSDEFGDKAKL